MTRPIHRVIICVLCSLLATPTLACGQRNGSASLLSLHPIGVYGSLEGGPARLAGRTVATSGAELGLVFNHRFSVGLAGYGLVNRDVPVPVRGRAFADTLRFGYGGLRLAYRAAPDRAIHAGGELFVGSGEIRTSVDTRPELEEDHVFVLVPGAFVETNLGPWLRGVAGLSYRYVSDIDWAGVAPSRLSGMEFRVGLRAGRF